MKSLSKAVAIASLISASALTAQVANAEVEFNAGAVSNYVWRGVTQNDDKFAVQGGADYSHESGAYAGVWGSTLDLDAASGDDTIEYDLYAGYATEANGVELDFGYISYLYDESGEFSAEVYAIAAMGDLTASLYQDIDATDATYLSVGYDVALPQELGLSLVGGYTIPDSGDNSFDVLASLATSFQSVDLSLNATYEETTEESEVFLSVGTAF